MRNLYILTAYVLLVPFVPCQSAHRLPVADFITESTGEWETYVDRRELLVMSHDWLPSATGGYAQAKVQARIPEGSQGPYRLSLYQSDDYFNDFWRTHNDSWLGGDGFFGHRFKQVWAGNELLWESDVGDLNPPKVSGQLTLDLPNDLKPGESIEITLKVVDKVSSWIELASDTQHISTTETAAEKPGDPAKYWTHVYWGNVSILSAGEEPNDPVAPIAKVVEETHQKNWPPPPYGDPDLDLPLEFTLDCAAPLPWGYPVRCGIPLPYGRVRFATEVYLSRVGEPFGSPVQGQEVEKVSQWEDGSIRFLAVNFRAQRRDVNGLFLLKRADWEDRYERSRIQLSQIKITPLPNRFDLEENRLEVFEHHPEPRTRDGKLDSETIEQMLDLDFRAQTKGEEILFDALSSSSSEETYLFPMTVEGTLHSSISQVEKGRFRILKEGLHPHTFSLCLFFDQPMDDPIREISFTNHVLWEYPLPRNPFWNGGELEFRGGTTSVSIGPETGKEEPPTPFHWIAIPNRLRTHLFVLRNAPFTGHTGFELTKTTDKAGEQGTKLKINLYKAANEDSGYEYTAGEAKTFQFLYVPLSRDATSEVCEKIAANFERPPLLVNNDVACRSGAFGYALPPGDGVAEEIPEWLKKTYPDPLGTSLQWGKTPRDFGDTIYNATNSWRNGYYDLRQGFVAAYLLSGNREWADALDRAVQHYVDVDTIHSSTDHPDHIGLAHGYGENHTSMDPWDPILRMNGVLAAAHIWGNDRYYEAAMTMARKIAETGRALGSGSVRDHAGVMMSIATAYREAHDPLFKEAGEKLIDDIITNRVDKRRGTYPEVHGNWNYRGNVPWMTAQLMEPLYLFYRETGNLDAAKLVVGFAESILCENQTRGVPGDIHGYSHNPHFTKNGGYHILIAPCLFYAYELTGDEEFKQAAVAAWEQILPDRSFNDVQNCFWNAPTLVYYLRKFAVEGN